MSDKFDARTRSYIMSCIRGKWTSPERKLHNHLKGWKIHHMMHPKIHGSPDVYLKSANTLVFIDGCFWHGCPQHGHIPESRKEFWSNKIRSNMVRDKRYTTELCEMGYKVVRIWECEIMGKQKETLTALLKGLVNRV